MVKSADSTGSLDGYGVYVALTLAINTVFSPSLLGIPYTFQAMGYVIAIFYLIYNAFLSYYLTRLVIEILARVDLIDKLKHEGYTVERPKFWDIFWKKRDSNVLDTLMQTPAISTLRYDFPQVVSVLFGKVWGFIYFILMCAYFQAELI